jgi:NADP-dependent 3-hydroxy acid dehydrogenase YdfG
VIENVENGMRKQTLVIEGKVAIVTGASSGIGEATAREFARAGAITVLAARRADRLHQLRKEIEEMGGKTLVVPTDLTSNNQITNLVHTTLATLGRIDILANIAGWGFYDWLEELSAEDLRMHYDVNVIGLAELTRQVIPAMKAQRSGFILNMSSYVSRISVPPLTVYASTKYAVEGLTDGLRRALLPWGIYVIRIHPSSVSGTEFNKKVIRNGQVEYKPVPIGRIRRERLARHIVGLIAKPRRALFISRIYEVPVWINKLFPEVVDWISATWVRRKQIEEKKPLPQNISPVRYASSFSLWHMAGGLSLIGLITLLLRRKR